MHFKQALMCKDLKVLPNVDKIFENAYMLPKQTYPFLPNRNPDFEIVTKTPLTS